MSYHELDYGLADGNPHTYVDDQAPFFTGDEAGTEVSVERSVWKGVWKGVWKSVELGRGRRSLTALGSTRTPPPLPTTDSGDQQGTAHG